MRPALWPLVAAAALITLPSTGRAQVYEHACRGRATTELAVMYVNGMLTSFAEAERNRSALEPIARYDVDTKLQSIDVELLYNQKKGVLQELWEAAKQRTAISPAEFLGFLDRALDAPEWFQELMLEFVTKLGEHGTIVDSDLETHLQRYRDRLSHGQRVLLVSHSQGNFYANAAYARLFGEQNEPDGDALRIVAIASPDWHVAGGRAAACPSAGCYTTLERDVIIAGVRAVFPDTLAGNVDSEQGWPGQDWMSHGLIEAYLWDPQPRRQIVRQMKAQLDDMVASEGSLPDGVITASLEWTAAADLDLHVVEADGRSHVAYWSPYGAVGQLDRDDQDGPSDGETFGRENYHAECGALRSGNYSFGAGYYEGKGPVTARLQLTIGDVTRTFTRTLARPMGAEVEPLPIASLEITDLGDGRFAFVVAGAKPESSEIPDP